MKKNSAKYPRYDTTLRREWIAALRSGNYKQGYSQLRNNDQFCVLGVLADLIFKKYPKQFAAHKDRSGSYEYDGRAFVLSEEMAALAGLSGPDGACNRHAKLVRVIGEDIECSLANLSDNGMSFAELAALIDDPKSGVFLKT